MGSSSAPGRAGAAREQLVDEAQRPRGVLAWPLSSRTRGTSLTSVRVASSGWEPSLPVEP
jgi:hypothetical protein